MQTKLRPGDILQLQDGEFIVDYVNECRARCIPTTLRQVEITTTFDGTKTFRALGRSISISTYLDTSLIKTRSGLEGLAAFLSSRSTSATAAATPKLEKHPLPKLTPEVVHQVELL